MNHTKLPHTCIHEVYKCGILQVKKYTLYKNTKYLYEQGYLYKGTKPGQRRRIYISAQGEEVLSYFNRSLASFTKEYEKRMEYFIELYASKQKKLIRKPRVYQKT